MQPSLVAHFFWAYGELSALERLSIGSFMRHGWCVRLWTYGLTTSLPAGVERCDARRVIPESGVFTYANGSYAGFANLFRYAVLSREGGLWADTDVICLSPSSRVAQENPDGFFVTERTQAGEDQVNPNVIFHPKPRTGDLIDLAHAVADRFDPEQLKWGDCGPRLLTWLARAYPRLAPRIMEPDFANPIDWWRCPQDLLSADGHIPPGTAFLHCYNETWRRLGRDKDVEYPPGSIMAQVHGEYARAW